jgi:adenylosuccinate lyase
MGFDKTVPVCGQTYSRKVDAKIMDLLARIAQSAAKMATDVRLLSHLKEIEEPFGKKQIGSSAMAYKRNPMRSERVCSLARFVCSMPQNTANTHATQWMERTLDDSANRRLSLPQAFLATDAILILVSNIIDGCQVWPHVIRKRIDSELPFMATENIIMAAVKAGGDRQQLHEAIRVHSNEAGRRVKEEGAENDLMERLRQDDLFSAIHADLENLMSPELYIGRAPQQVNEFLESEVKPALETAKADVQTVDGEVFV